MGWLRLARRFVLFGGVTLLGFLVLVLTTPVVRLARPDTSRWRARLMTLWARLGSRVLGMRLTVVGAPPRPPFFLVTNHLSYVDVLVLASQAPCAFLAKAEISSWPVFGVLTRLANTVFIDRESRRDIPSVLARIERRLASGVGIVVFPEATSSRGAAVLPFRSALLDVPARSGLAVSYAALTYATPAGSPSAQEVVCWWGDMTFGAHVLALFRIPSFDAKVVFGAEALRDDDRKTLAAKLHDAVAGRFEPVV